MRRQAPFAAALSFDPQPDPHRNNIGGFLEKTEQETTPAQLIELNIHFFLVLGACASALAAALFALSLKRLSRNTLDAMLATRLLVCLVFLAIQHPPFFRFLSRAQRARTVLVVVLVLPPLLVVVLT